MNIILREMCLPSLTVSMVPDLTFDWKKKMACSVLAELLNSNIVSVFKDMSLLGERLGLK
jgi:hypothetical protein